MSANDYYGGGSGNNQQSYGHSYGNDNQAGGQPFSPAPMTYTPDSSTQHSPYPGSAQPYDQRNQQDHGGYQHTSGMSNAPAYGGSQDYQNTQTGPYYNYGSQAQSQSSGYQNYDSQAAQTPDYQQGYSGSYDNRQYGGPAQSQYDQYPPNTDYQQQFGGLSLNDNTTSTNYNQPTQQGGYDYASPNAATAKAYDQNPSYNNYPTSHGATPAYPAYPVTDPNNRNLGLEADRGLLGALGGAAVGGYAGHKVNHGFLGAVGGGINGHLAEEALKKKHKGDKKDKKDMKYKQNKPHKQGRRNSSSSSSSSSSSDSDDSHKKKKKHGKQNLGLAAAGGGVAGYAAHSFAGGRAPSPQPAAFKGNFSASSSQISLHPHGSPNLTAACANMSGHQVRSQINLNDVLTNNYGTLKWARGGNFAASARNIVLKENGRVLECELRDGNGNWKRSWIRLDEGVENSDGRLQYVL